MCNVASFLRNPAVFVRRRCRSPSTRCPSDDRRGHGKRHARRRVHVHRTPNNKMCARSVFRGDAHPFSPARCPIRHNRQSAAEACSGGACNTRHRGARQRAPTRGPNDRTGQRWSSTYRRAQWRGNRRMAERHVERTQIRDGADARRRLVRRCSGPPGLPRSDGRRRTDPTLAGYVLRGRRALHALWPRTCRSLPGARRKPRC